KLLEIESRDYVKHFTSVQPYGKAFGMFDQYKIEFRNQFVYTTDYGEDVTIELNKKALNIHTNEEDLLTYGPIVPGVYTFEVAYKNDFGEANSTVEKRVDDEYGEGIRLDLESIDYVTAVLSQRIPVESVFVVNEKELKFDEDGRLRFEPILIDGSLSGHLVSKLTWGEVKSDEYPIEDN